VKCSRDTSSSSTIPNGTTEPHIHASQDLPPSAFNPLVNGDAMGSDDEDQEAGVIIVDSTARAATSTEHRSSPF